jgi:hypothetical protein
MEPLEQLRKDQREQFEKMDIWRSTIEKDLKGDVRWANMERDQKNKDIDDQLKRDADSINSLNRQVRHIKKFERIVLKSMEVILIHLKSGNHNEKMDATLEQITDFMFKEFHEDDDN